MYEIAYLYSSGQVFLPGPALGLGELSGRPGLQTDFNISWSIYILSFKQQEQSVRSCSTFPKNNDEERLLAS